MRENRNRKWIKKESKGMERKDKMTETETKDEKKTMRRAKKKSMKRRRKREERRRKRTGNQ